MRIINKKVLLTLLLLSATFLVHAQSDSLLKSFINKNNFAIRSVQKQCVKSPQLFESTDLKELLQLQLVSVESFESNKETCKSAAFQLRKTCVDFLSKIDPKQLITYEVNTKELAYFSKSKEIKDSKSLVDKRLRSAVEKADFRNPNVFNDFVLNIK